MCISGKSEECGAVISQNGAVHSHLAADRHIRMAGEQPVTKKVKRDLGAGHVGANEIAKAERQLTDKRPYERLQSIRNRAYPAPEQSDQFGQMRAPGTGHGRTHRIDQLKGISDIQRDVDWKKRDPISEVGCLRRCHGYSPEQ